MAAKTKCRILEVRLVRESNWFKLKSRYLIKMKDFSGMNHTPNKNSYRVVGSGSGNNEALNAIKYNDKS